MQPKVVEEGACATRHERCVASAELAGRLEVAEVGDRGPGLGIDRLVMLLARERSIREVIAFPKNQSASDLMMGAPSAVEETQLRDLGLALRPPTRA